MTLIEALVVMGVLAVLVTMTLPAFVGQKSHCSQRISCVNNLKQVGTAYRIWENDNGDKYLMQQTATLGGMSNLLASSDSAGPFAYLPYTIMENELGQSPKVVVCPSDERSANTNFYPGNANAPRPAASYKLAGVGTFDNTNVSYFVGVGAIDTYPQSLLGGDRNLGNASPQDPYYGISGTTANPQHPCGADAIVNTNGTWSFAVISGGGGSISRGQPVAWSAKIHSAGNSAGAGNIMLGDGSAQQCTSAGFRQNWLRNAIDTGNFASFDRIHSSTNGSIRLLFP